MGDCSSKAAPPPKSGGAAPQKAAEGAPAAAAAPTPAAQNQEQDYESTAAEACPADVYMFSGCKDKQTSADVGDVMSFGVPGPGGAGGACTNALLKHCYKPGEVSWAQVLSSMVKFLEEQGYTQRPMLSTSRKTDLKEKFTISGDQSGDKHALLIGINYVSHEKGRLSGCVNDVVSMKSYIKTQGFSEDNMVFITDEDHSDIPSHQHPNKKDIEEAIDTFVGKAKPGDSLFFHYSGHGGQKADQWGGDEADGKDETLIPDDYQSNGVIRDDELFTRLCSKLPKGVRLVAVMDCCHSGTILDLPYSFEATAEGLQKVETEGGSTMANTDFTSVLKKLFARVGGNSSSLGPLGAVGKKLGFL
eukprot:TRINITY_DN34943_c0_g2_i1.p2 TRINITY_DN34943_c0_g2~~TRINITY_DN34943_c0_g2_i1.p2  ORF type:complete len:380 (+),score=182.03 TRINITY_DN34943_c0_g2_i1:61-1140(+)